MFGTRKISFCALAAIASLVAGSRALAQANGTVAGQVYEQDGTTTVADSFTVTVVHAAGVQSYGPFVNARGIYSVAIDSTKLSTTDRRVFLVFTVTNTTTNTTSATSVAAVNGTLNSTLYVTVPPR